MNLKKFIIWSNVFFILPLFFSLYIKMWIPFILILGVTISSFLYHIAEEKKFIFADSIFAWLLIISNLWVCYLGFFKFPYFFIALLFVFCALYFYFTDNKYNRNFNHGMWHIFSSLITIFSLLTFWTTH